ncbi:MAG: hypothetical protein ACP5D7_07105 [Limnospira sp.]
MRDQGAIRKAATVAAPENPVPEFRWRGGKIPHLPTRERSPGGKRGRISDPR